MCNTFLADIDVYIIQLMVLQASYNTFIVHVHSTHTKTSFVLSSRSVDEKDLYRYSKCVLVSWLVGRSIGRCRLSCPSYIKLFSFFSIQVFENGRSLVTVQCSFIHRKGIYAGYCVIPNTHAHTFTPSAVQLVARSLGPNPACVLM